MKKTVWLLLAVWMVISFPVINWASEFQGAQVYVRIEGRSQTRAEGTVAAYTFRESLERLAADNGLTLTFAQSGADSRLLSVEGPADATDNRETASPETGEQWTGYIIRNEQVVRQEAYLDIPLLSGDEVVLYFGIPDETRVVTQFTCEYEEGTLLFYVAYSGTDWRQVDGTWVPHAYVLPLEGINLHVTLPDGQETSLRTGADGHASLPCDTPGVVRYYAEGYRDGKAPLIVRTSEHLSPCGFDTEVVTRAGAVAFMMHMYTLETEKDRPLDIWFSDINEETAFYNELIAAANRGLIAGYEDGTFRPDQPVDLMQVCVLTARLFPALYDEGPAIEELPLWAAGAAGGLYHAGLLEGVGTAWADTVTPEMLVTLYQNLE